MKLVIENGGGYGFFVYREDEKHHKKMNKHRDPAMRKPLKDCDKDCQLQRGEYIVINLKKGQR